jgi:hypothetical protein
MYYVNGFKALTHLIFKNRKRNETRNVMRKAMDHYNFMFITLGVNAN